MKMHYKWLQILLLAPVLLSAQNVTQQIHGIVTDAQSQSPIPGVLVRVLNSDSLIGTSTDVDGKYILQGVHIGHVTLGFSMMGYKPVVLNNIVLDIGKEGIVNITMEEYVDTLKEVVVHSGKSKDKPLNDMSTLSARQFSPDDASRYAGALSDPSRMATNFAGVGVANDSRNDIVIRGNSPLGLLWKLDGVNIPNPNHFGTLGSTGGPVSILNNNMLDQSDFMTGAFPAEYGNAIAGVFDLKMRNGNTERSEFAGELGFNGLEVQAEGPFSKGSNASYNIDYRYSTLAVFQLLGINYGFAAVPQYQDLSFTVNIPLGIKYGTISIFGLGGPSYIALLAKDQSKSNLSTAPINEDTYFNSNMGVVGASYKLFFNEKTSQTIAFAVSGLQNITKIDTDYNNTTKLTFGQNETDIISSLSYTINTKVNPRNTIKAGVSADIYYSNYADSVLQDSSFTYGERFKSTNTLLQTYVEWQHKFTDNIVLNAGLHYQDFLLNTNSTAFEPRLGIRWNFAPKQSIAIAGGLHSEMQPISVYYYENKLPDGSYASTNKDLGFSKSAHLVLGYDYAFIPGWRMKIETYYQYLYNIPVQIQSSSYSVLNIGASYYDPPYDSLTNKGIGRNYGAELTLEKFFNKTYYVLCTASLYQSKYEGSDGIERNTAFNGNYTLNALAGGDINLDKARRKVISISAKINYAGGKWYTPINLTESEFEHVPIYESNLAFSEQYPPYSRIDLKVAFKLNSKRITQEWAFEAQNIFNRQNIFQQIYNPNTNALETDYQLGFFPVGSYRITF
ncbi:MAG TPA: TonB-dependent receptor [Bacteroidia bacterium]|nr:TonB-dependent receptor [Bacteroidia bacterium]